MKITVLKIPQFRIFPIAKFAKYKYVLNDSSYGEMLLFEKNIPKYYINLFDVYFKELKEFIEKTGNMEDILAEIIRYNKISVTVKQELLGIDLPFGETVAEMDLIPFPSTYWQPYLAANLLY